MANLRIIEVKVIDSTNIRATFTHDLDSLITTSNITIESNVPGVPDVTVLKLSIRNKTIDIETLPLAPFAAYFITFKSIQNNFKSKNGDAYLLDDGVNNKILIFGAEEPDNSFRDGLLEDIHDSIYNTDTSTLLRNTINGQANILNRCMHDIGQLKNDNYLSVTIYDERKVRSAGPFDRLNEEGAYDLLRVGKNLTGTVSSEILSFPNFTSGLITLQTKSIVGEVLVAGSGPSTFDKLILTTLKKPVIKLNKVQINYSNSTSATYDINSFGYQINDPKYDTDFASTFLTLETNQFKLNDLILSTSFIAPTAADKIIIDYDYKDFGKIINEESIDVYIIKTNTHESVQPLQTELSLKFAPVTDANGNIPSLNGMSFLDPQSNPPFSSTHPSFKKELPFNFSNMPKAIGEYILDYTTGRIFVFGENDTNNGTGYFPPLAVYNYKKSFSNRLDFTYNPDTFELVANPLRDLAGQSIYISFDFEETLVEGIDFKSQIHKEALDERIENRINSINSISVKNTPITNVFRIFNETNGEVYKISRWNDYKVFFTSTVPPAINDKERENVSFELVFNEILLNDSEITNINNIRVLKILLNNNRIISSTEDSIGASFNSTVQFSRADIFTKELYFDGQTLTITQNINKLNINQYQVDYTNGIIYIGVSLSQNKDIGTVSYKKSTIVPKNPHLVSVNAIYNSRGVLTGIDKKIDYVSFEDNEIIPKTLDIADERFLNGDITQSYQILSDEITVTYNIGRIHNLYDSYDLNNNINPINFAETSSFNNNIITLSGGVNQRATTTVLSGLKVKVPFVSAGIEIESVVSVKRISDNVELFDSLGSFLEYDITLSGTGSPTIGTKVYVIYNLKLNGAATPIIDYNKGDLFIDYTYLADEIFISYEYGDNVLDFRESNSLNIGDEYFVTYKIGALRDALLKNFGSLINIPIMNSFDTSLSRETYRDAVTGAMQSFTSGPTIPSITNIVSSITHIDPEITEAAFDIWSLGISDLYRSAIDYTDDISIIKGKFDNGLYLDKEGQTVTFPISGNLKIEEGTLEMWTIPDWNGLDNDATLTFEIFKGNNHLNSSNIYIGATSFNPTLINNKFSINKEDVLSPKGFPSAIYTNVGIFIYFDVDNNSWKIFAKDSVKTPDGYVYSGTVQSSGEVYDVRFIPGLGEINDIIRSAVNSIFFEFHIDSNDALSPDGYSDGYSIIDGYHPGDGYVSGYSFDGLSFMADDEHYLFDFGKSINRSRFSIFKDGKGFLNFRINDNLLGNKVNQYKVSTDISTWKSGEHHHIAVSWKLNTSDRKDEMHLFLDGQEVPNILRYGGRPQGTSTDRFRTVKPEIIAGTIPLKTLAGNDLVAVYGSSTVTSTSTNFTNEGIIPGYSITLREDGFSTYNILGVAGKSLVLNQTMPITLTSIKYSINQFSTTVSSQIDLYKNIAVSIINSQGEKEISGLRADIPSYSISKDLFNQNVLTILGSAGVGDHVAIRTLGLNHRRAREQVYIWGNTTSILKTLLPPPINLDEVKIIPVLLPLKTIGPNTATLSAGKFVGTFQATQPSNATEGRTLSVRITGNNVNFTPNPKITINGTTFSGATSEILLFSSATSKSTIQKFKTITSVSFEVKPFITTSDSTSIEIREAFSITETNGNNTYPILRFSYKTQKGTSLQGTIGTSIVTDSNGFFVDSNIGQILVISSPGSVAGTYTIASRTDDKTVILSTNLPATFTSGAYNIFNTSLGRSGFQNGFFTLETAGLVNTPFLLKQGFYEFDYSTYLEIPFDPVTSLKAYVGSDVFGKKQAKAIIDEFRILSTMLTDVRIGESLVTNQDYITTDFNSIKPFKKNSDTLMLLHFDNLPLENDSDIWVTSGKDFIQSSNAINENFDKCIVITDKPIIQDNKGALVTRSEGSIEFWVSPRFDTYNDPVRRYYFDATSGIIEKTTSVSNGTVKANSTISKILSVRLSTDINNIGTDYFAGGSISADFQTINLGTSLPGQQTQVKIDYIPLGLAGDRISIYKSEQGFITFNIRSEGTDYQVRQPIFWSRDSWHRIMATYKFNRLDNQDEIRLFVDGEERGVIRFGSGLLFGDGTVFGQGFAGVDNSILIGDINFTDPINEFYIGSSYLGVNAAQARIDNLRLSNISRNPLVINGQAKDINYQSNISMVQPVIEDAYTTLLLNLDSLKFKKEDFAIVRNESFGISNFTLDIIDSFDIVKDDPKVKQMLESLIKALKPAASKATINYLK